MYIRLEKPSPKSRVIFVRTGKRRFELEFNWCVNTISLSTGIQGSYSRKIFIIKRQRKIKQEKIRLK